MYYFCWRRQSCTYSIQFVSLLVVCCQVKLVKNCSNIGQKLAKVWSKVGQKSWSKKLVKLVKSRSKVGQKLVKSWSSLSKFGQVDQKLTNLVKLVKK
jgi:hypothetical protein